MSLLKKKAETLESLYSNHLVPLLEGKAQGCPNQQLQMEWVPLEEAQKLEVENKGLHLIYEQSQAETEKFEGELAQVKRTLAENKVFIQSMSGINDGFAKRLFEANKILAEVVELYLHDLLTEDDLERLRVALKTGENIK
jgi:hypothetical protein